MTNEKLKQLLAALIPSITDRKFLPEIDRAGDVQKAVTIKIEDTEPTDRPIVFGIPLENSALLHAEILNSLAKVYSSSQDNSIIVPFHSSNGVNFDIRIYRPYRIRKDKSGEIIRVDLFHEEQQPQQNTDKSGTS